MMNVVYIIRRLLINLIFYARLREFLGKISQIFFTNFLVKSEKRKVIRSSFSFLSGGKRRPKTPAPLKKL